VGRPCILEGFDPMMGKLYLEVLKMTCPKHHAFNVTSVNERENSAVSELLTLLGWAIS
jgi:hypothetical protein